jgi:hypothetical protein
MPTSTEDVLDRFFTEERLEYYRNLHKLFPLWCGDWREPECLEPEYAYWSYSTRREREYLRITAGRERLAFVTDEDGRRSLLVSEANSGSTSVAFSVLDAAILEAIELCCQREGGQRVREGGRFPSDVVEAWARELIDLVNPQSPRWRSGPGIIPFLRPEPVSGFYALQLRRRVLNAPIRSKERA